MFSLVHFSRVFPYIHPYLFPIETPKADLPPAAEKTAQVCPEPPADNHASLSVAENPSSVRPSVGRHLKSLHRRHLRSQRNETLTYSGLPARRMVTTLPA